MSKGFLTKLEVSNQRPDKGERYYAALARGGVTFSYFLAARSVLDAKR